MFGKLRNRLGIIPGRKTIISVMGSAHRDGSLTRKQ
ncbi:hypothetical protein E2C01_055592 [Portunus trituberculatus]|uniref:Uncharacterized protein n=1 Tax=Portunus trituberculatus TaxID=210409 RepID=A0A5B7GVF8_PORTR|nr:hypothetical protein [Portunus trituberculatus]